VQVVVSFKEEAVASALAAEAAPIAAAAAAAAEPASAASAPAPAAAARLRAMSAVKARALSAASAAVAQHGAKVEADFSHLPAAVVTVANADALAALRADAGVASVEAAGVKRQMLLQSAPLIAQPAALARGANGAGCAVAVIDGGGNYGHKDLGSCATPGAPAPCRVAFAKDFTPENAFTKTDAHSTNGEELLGFGVFWGGGLGGVDRGFRGAAPLPPRPPPPPPPAPAAAPRPPGDRLRRARRARTRPLPSPPVRRPPPSLTLPHPHPLARPPLTPLLPPPPQWRPSSPRSRPARASCSWTCSAAAA
jgi:subtilisin family serine protease